jgi:transposase, IS30 family
MYRHITSDDRAGLGALLRSGKSQAAVARELGVHPSTVSRELKRNVNEFGSYHAAHARVLARSRRKNSKQKYRKIENNPTLASQIELLLHPLRSPECVAQDVAVAHETIYAWIARSRPDLKEKLPYRGRKRRRYGSKRQVKQGWTRYVRPIDERPVVVEKRRRLGDKEGDTVRGVHGALLTHADRTSRFLDVDLVPNEGADAAHQKIVARYKDSDCKTITYDRGSTFALWRMIERDLNIKVYFAHAHHPWERGTNENTNGRLRRVFPKGFDFSTITQADVDKVVSVMNHTRRKCLGWRTPCAVSGTCCTSD